MGPSGRTPIGAPLPTCSNSTAIFRPIPETGSRCARRTSTSFPGHLCHRGSVPAASAATPSPGRTPFRGLHAKSPLMGPSRLFCFCWPTRRSQPTAIPRISGPVHHPPRHSDGLPEDTTGWHPRPADTARSPHRRNVDRSGSFGVDSPDYRAYPRSRTTYSTFVWGL